MIAVIRFPSTEVTIPSAHIRPWLVFWLCCAFYILTASGHTYAPDEETMIAVSDAIVHTQSVALRHADGQPWSALRDGINYGRYASYGILPSLLIVPISVVVALFSTPGTLVAADAVRLLASFVNAPITAATIACLAVLINRTTLPRSGRIWTLVCAAAGACLWPYARSFFSEPLTMLLITASLASATRRPVTTGSVFLAALCAGLILPTRIAAVVAIPILATAAYWTAPLRRSTVLAACAGVIPGIALWGTYNVLRYGTFFATGYGTESTAFDTPFLTGLTGLLVSGGSGLIWYAPFVIWIPVGARYWWHHDRRMLSSALGLVLTHLLLYASWSAWDGGGVWGPRFLVPIIPAALLVAAGVWATPARIVRSAAQLTVLLGIGITFLGAAVNFSIDSNLPVPREIPPIAHARILWDRLRSSTVSAQTCRIETNWHPSEAVDGHLWQRSNGASTFSCRLEPLSILRLHLDDRRPEQAAASAMLLQVGDDAQYPIPAGTFRRIHLLSRAGMQHYTLRSTPWNARALGLSDRDDDLGPTLLDIRSTPALARISDASTAPMPSQPIRRWAWYYEPTNRHPGDWWVWYLPHTALADWSALLIAGWLACVSICLGAATQVWRRTND